MGWRPGFSRHEQRCTVHKGNMKMVNNQMVYSVLALVLAL